MPRGSHVLISPYGLHRDPRVRERPDVFNPDRYSTDINRNAFIPFNVGPLEYTCIRTAYIEGVPSSATIPQKYMLQVREDWRPLHQ
ncbi:cytochrome P450 [Nocardia sp. CA-135953]|uniref:cytochrome P450 n=1 Tax=Nocardia sp. CA-135953 TaxID=3239978 RepID=UPI003D95F4E3